MPDYSRIDPLRFEAAVKDPSPFVVVLGDRRSGKTTLIKQRMSKEYGSHNIVLVHNRGNKFLFDDCKEHIERFYTDTKDLRGISRSDKNLFIDEFLLVEDFERLFPFRDWKSITMVSSIYKILSFDESRFNQASFHDWYSSTALPRELGYQSSLKFRLQVD